MLKQPLLYSQKLLKVRKSLLLLVITCATSLITNAQFKVISDKEIEFYLNEFKKNKIEYPNNIIYKAHIIEFSNTTPEPDNIKKLNEIFKDFSYIYEIKSYSEIEFLFISEQKIRMEDIRNIADPFGLDIKNALFKYAIKTEK